VRAGAPPPNSPLYGLARKAPEKALLIKLASIEVIAESTGRLLREDIVRKNGYTRCSFGNLKVNKDSKRI
jgi:hypothetical protein